MFSFLHLSFSDGSFKGFLGCVANKEIALHSEQKYTAETIYGNENEVWESSHGWV